MARQKKIEANEVENVQPQKASKIIVKQRFIMNGIYYEVGQELTNVSDEKIKDLKEKGLIQ